MHLLRPVQCSLSKLFITYLFLYLFLLDRSKQRARLRKWMISDKAKLKTHLDLYNNLHPDQPKVTLSEVLEGKKKTARREKKKKPVPMLQK